ncbi:viral inclusion body protein [Wad Medani virus]|uniref:Non-structural protein NS2 n=1 Tax=Wad Medani virus TaxID=40067 RepID=A0A0H4M5A6_9REOV|nr:viral inclusion body protein [Wad Medani virus]AKP24079.1 viral inclusion body protein [Wad Medani virus]
MASQDSRVPMIRRPFLRTISIHSTGTDDYVSKTCHVMKGSYLIVKQGMGSQQVVSDTPATGGMVLVIPGPGSYRLLDRDQSTFIIVDVNGIEVMPDRWPGFCFETVDMSAHSATIDVGSEEVPGIVSYGRAAGTIPPYTPDGNGPTNTITLPGIKFVKSDEPMRELRVRLKEEREEHATKITRAVRALGASRAAGRALGVRAEDLSGLTPPVRESLSFSSSTSIRPSPTTSFTPVTRPAKPMASSTPPPPPVTPLATRPAPPSAALQKMAPVPAVKTAPAPPVTDTITFGPDFNALLEEMAQGVMREVPDASFSSLSAPGAVGYYSDDFGVFSIPATTLPAYTFDATSQKYEYTGVRSVTSVHAVASDGVLYAVPE